MKCSISTYYKILDAELYNYDDGYMKLNADVNAKSIDLEEYASKQKKSIADMCNVPEEKVIPISRLELKHMQMSKERKPICTANARSAERN